VGRHQEEFGSLYFLEPGWPPPLTLPSTIIFTGSTAYDRRRASENLTSKASLTWLVGVPGAPVLRGVPLPPGWVSSPVILYGPTGISSSPEEF
jgi:hypothetical protein